MNAKKHPIEWTLFSAYTLFFITGLVFVLSVSKAESFLLLTACHSPFLDGLFKYWTFLGDGAFSGVFALAALFKKLRYGIYFLLTYIVSGLTVQILKRFLFSAFPRPHKYFEILGREIVLVPGVDILRQRSFPSGHTATAFALFIGIALLVRNKTLKIGCLLIAIGVGYSRVFLAHHFPMDVIAGSIIGVITAAVFYPIMLNWRGAWLDQSLPQWIQSKKRDRTINK